jgi:thermitase
VPEVVAAGIRWAADRGAHVINLSLTGRTGAGACTIAHQEAIDYAWSHQVVVIAAAGNDGADVPVRPGGCAHVLAVAAVTDDGARADFSNHGAWVGVAAPGVDILSLNPSGGYERMSGTSMAAPVVSGLAARVWAGCGPTTALAVIERLTATADPIAGTGTNWQYGRVNADRATC